MKRYSDVTKKRSSVLFIERSNLLEGKTLSHNIISFHIVNDIPWSNLNRDDTGTPKRTILGGVERGMLSSQSIKRAIRKDYENRILDEIPETFMKTPISDENVSAAATIRSRNTVQWVIERAKVLAEEAGVELDTKKATSKANTIVKNLVGGEDTIIWLSIEELEAFAHVILEDFSVDDKSILDKIMPDKKSGALAIAAFGRMFASAANKSTEAAIAVSPAISTHSNLIETDYFIAGDDYGFFAKDKKTGDVRVSHEGAGAAHLGVSLYTSGIFYRTVSIEINELIANWTGITSEDAEQHLRVLIHSIINSLPSGKNNHTGPYTVPTLIIAERQNYREAYSIADPVLPHENGGFLKPSIEGIKEQYEKTRVFNASNYSDSLISGSQADKVTATPATIDEIVENAVNWIISSIPAPIIVDEVEELIEESDSIDAESVDVAPIQSEPADLFTVNLEEENNEN